MTGDAHLRIIVDVKADAREEGVEKLGENWYSLRVKETKRGGRANAAALKLLRRHLGRRGRIVSGFTGTRKIVELDDGGEL